MSRPSSSAAIGLLSGVAAIVASLVAYRHRNQQRERIKEDNVKAELQEYQKKRSVHKFVITGGPCSGKTTSMERIQVYLRERGFRCFVVPEAATIFFQSGASVDDFSLPGCPEAFQQFVINFQLNVEDRMARYAESTGQPAVLLCDRGVLDGAAYVDKSTWQRVLDFAGVDEVQARDGRYDAVFHLVTAADGAEGFYSNATNATRSEGLQEAMRLDRATQVAWAGHSHHHIIDNSGSKSFEKKMQQLISLMSSYVGLPSLRKRSVKYTIAKPDLLLLPESYMCFDVEKVILRDTFRSDKFATVDDLSLASPQPSFGRHGGVGKELHSFLRKRTQGKQSAYAMTTLRVLPSGEEIELKQNLSKRMYHLLCESYKDTTRHIVRQRRYFFLHEKQSFQIIESVFPDDGLWTMRVQSNEAEPSLPPWVRQATRLGEHDGQWSAYSRSVIDRSSPMTVSSGPR